MKLSIEHETIFIYDKPIREATGEARVQPRDEAGQRRLNFALHLEPPAPAALVRDRFGNAVHSYSILQPHRKLLVTATSVVDTSDAPLIAAPALSVLEQHSYLAPSHYVPAAESLDRLARELAPDDGDAEGIGWALTHGIYRSFTYEPGSTDIETTADRVLEGGRGVCQDFAHLMIGLCRSLGVPARYVSGYLYDSQAAPDAVLAMHAWVEVFLAGQGWLGLDPTHDRAVNDAYTRVAVGRDYADATPMRGVYKGDARETLEARVRIRALEATLGRS
jgi:transglutaminase-like putative cysteine protease